MRYGSCGLYSCEVSAQLKAWGKDGRRGLHQWQSVALLVVHCAAGTGRDHLRGVV